MKLKTALLQYSQVWGNQNANLEKINSLIDNKITDEEIIILPEMSVTGFTMEADKYSEEIDGISTHYFVEKSREIKKHIFAGIIENDNGKIYNSLVHFDKQGLITSRYRKIHPFSLAKEEEYYESGKEIAITQIEEIKIGLTICYDLRFPELYRLYAKEGCKLLINIASWPTKRIEHWKTLLRAHAIANQAYVIGVNRIGNDPFNEYNGNSVVIDPMGKIIITNEGNEAILSAEMNFEYVNQVRQSLGFLNDIKLI